MEKNKNVLVIDMKYMQIDDTIINSLKNFGIQYRNVFYELYILIENIESDTFHYSDQLLSLQQLNVYKIIDNMIQLGSIAEIAKSLYIEILLITNRPKFFNKVITPLLLPIRVFPIKYSSDLTNQLTLVASSYLEKSVPKNLPEHSVEVPPKIAPSTDSILREIRKVWVLNHNIPTSITPLINTIHDVSIKLKDSPGTEEDEYALLQRLFFEEYFENHLLVMMMKERKIRSMNDVRALISIKPTKKLEDFSMANTDPPTIPKITEVKMKREEVDAALKMIQEILTNFISQYKNKQFKSIKRINSLQSHFKNQLLTFSIAKTTPEIMCRLRNDVKCLDYIVNKILHWLLDKGYIKFYETKVLYDSEKFENIPVVFDIEDLGFDINKSNSKKAIAKSDNTELKKLVLQVTENICNHFIENCLKCFWENIKKTSSLKNHFMNLIRQRDSKSMSAGNIAKIKSDIFIQELIIGNILKYLTENGYIAIISSTVTYNHKAFENKRVTSFTLDSILINPEQLNEAIKKPVEKVQGGLLMMGPTLVHSQVEEKKDVKLMIEDDLLGKIKKRQIVIPNSIGELYNTTKKIVQDYMKKVHVDSQEQAILGVMKHLFESKQIFCDKVKQDFTLDSLKKIASARVEFLIK